MSNEYFNQYIFYKSKENKTDFETGKIEAEMEVDSELFNRIKEIHKAIKLGVINDLYGNGCPFIGIEGVRDNTFNYLSRNNMFGLLDERIINLQNKNDNHIEDDLKIQYIADRIFSSLPNFDKASIDEIVDIKKEISGYIKGFQRELVNLADQINNSVWDKYFIKDVEKQLIKQVWPQVQEIENAVKENKSLLDYANKTVESLVSPKAIASASIVGWALTKFGIPPDSEQSLCTCAGIALLHALLQTTKEKRKEKNEIKKNDFFLVYKVKNSLEKM